MSRPRLLPGQASRAAPPDVFLLLLTDLSRHLRARTVLLRRCRESPSVRNVHRLRVESRRLLARLELLAAFLPADVSAAARRAVRRQLKALAEVRDLQVQAIRIESLLPEHPELREFRRHLRRKAMRASRALRRKLARRKTSRRLHDLTVELAALPQATGTAVWGSLQQPLRQARGDVARQRMLSRRGVKGLHRLRLALKHCRYLTEALQPVLPPSSVEQLEWMRSWQTCLGDLHDLALLEAGLRQFARKHGLVRGYAGVRRLLAGRRRQLGAEHSSFSLGMKFAALSSGPLSNHGPGPPLRPNGADTRTTSAEPLPRK